MNWDDFRGMIHTNLSDDLLDKKHRHLKAANPNLPKTFGHCYVVSEVAYYLLGGKESGWTPQHINHIGRSHWYLKHESGAILDLTASQFHTPINYEEGKGKGFMTKEPSKRAKMLMRRMDQSNSWRLTSRLAWYKINSQLGIL
jgi:hypothetical protein